MQTGADHEPFLLSKQGLYAQENGIQIFHLLFKGNDLHSGNTPCSPLTTEQQAGIEELIPLTNPQNQVADVSYPSTVASTRSASMSVSPPPLGFWNLGSVAPHKAVNCHFSDGDVTFLGSVANCAQCFGVELTLALYNATIPRELSWEEDSEDFLKKLGYIDDTMISPALFGHHQDVDRPMGGAHSPTSKVKTVLGLFCTPEGVYLFPFVVQKPTNVLAGWKVSDI